MLLELILLLVTGVATGFLNVMAGGGSMLSVPVMIFLGVPSTVANATNRIAILPQNLAAVITFARRGFANIRLSLSLGLCTLPGALIGAYAATQISNDDFNVLLAIIMIAVLVIMSLPERKTQAHPSNAEEPLQLSKARLYWGHGLMVLIGFWGGFIHIGVGFLLMPVLHKVMQMDLVTTNSHKVFIVLVYTVVALIVFSSQLTLNWAYGAALAVGTVVGGTLAANFQIKQGASTVKWTLNLIIIAFIIKLLFF